MANNPTDRMNACDPMIATLWAKWLALQATRSAAPDRDRGNDHDDLGTKLRAVALLIASVPALDWADVLPKVSIIAMMKSEGRGEDRYATTMIEAAVAVKQPAKGTLDRRAKGTPVTAEA